MDVISDQEREFAAEVADFAMMAGWDRSILTHAKDSGMSEQQIILILNKAADYNDSADPKGRIDALEDWKKHKLDPEGSQTAARGPGKSLNTQS